MSRKVKEESIVNRKMYYDNNNVKRKLFTSEKIIIIYIIFITLLSPINNGNKPIVANITLKVKGPGTAIY